MKKTILFALAIISILSLQNCKKSSTADTTTTTTALLQATVNGALWTPTDTLSAIINYDPTKKVKSFYLNGTITQKQVAIALTISNATSTADVPLATYTVDATSNLVMNLNILQKNSAGAYVYLPQGTVGVGAGGITITAVDATNKTITGTFYFTSRKVNYDSSGNISSVEVGTVTGGSFNAMPFKFTNN